MENASKALIIAGAILLAILIIALGVYIFNQAKNYEGKINGTQAKALIDAIRNNNQTMPDLGDILVTTTGLSTNASGSKDNELLSQVKSAFDPTKRYTVSITNYQTAEGQYKGYVTAIKIEG